MARDLKKIRVSKKKKYPKNKNDTFGRDINLT